MAEQTYKKAEFNLQNIDDLVESVNIRTGLGKETGREYSCLQINFENGESMLYFPEDRSAVKMIVQQVEIERLTQALAAAK